MPKTETRLKIFCFVNSGANTDMQGVMAMCEDGRCLAGHCSSTLDWAKHDIGLTSDWKHADYKEHCPDGYELEWIDDPRNHAGLDVACAKNQELGKIAKAKEEQSGG